jgi:hypothetical protein
MAWKETVVAQFGVLSDTLIGEIEEDHEKFISELLFSVPKFDPRNSRKPSSITTTTFSPLLRQLGTLMLVSFPYGIPELCWSCPFAATFS